MARPNTVTTLNLTDLQRVVYSKEILMQATPILKWAQFAQKKTDLSVLPGHTLQMTRMANIKRGTRLGEIGVDQSEADAYNTAHPTHRVKAQSSIPMNKLSTSTRDIRVYEYGNGISISEMELQTAIEDTLNIASKQPALNPMVSKQRRHILKTSITSPKKNSALPYWVYSSLNHLTTKH